MAKYLVTGGAGFIGSHLSKALAAAGHEVVVLDNLSTGRRSNLDGATGKLELVEGSITDLDTVERCCRGVDCVFHQAALPSVPRSVADPIASDETNVGGTLRVFWGAHRQGVRRVVYAASSSVYGNTEELPKHEGMPQRPLSPYAVNKCVGEMYGAVFNNLYGLGTVGLRYFNVFGPFQDPQSQYAAVVPKFITSFLNEEAPVIHGDGEQSRDFTFVANVVEANIAACGAPDAAGGRSYNIALGGRISVTDLCLKIRDLVGAQVMPRYETERAGDVKHSQADVSLAREQLGYVGSVDLDDGLRRTVAWYRDKFAAGGGKA